MIVIGCSTVLIQIRGAGISPSQPRPRNGGLAAGASVRPGKPSNWGDARVVLSEFDLSHGVSEDNFDRRNGVLQANSAGSGPRFVALPAAPDGRVIRACFQTRSRCEAVMTPVEPIPTLSPLGPLARYEKNLIERIANFDDPRQEWRRLFSELLGTFFLVLAAAGGGMMSHAFPGVISHTAAVTAPALTVMAIILFMGKISGAHLNPAVSIAFALRRDFPWNRVPGYIVVQLAGATLAALVLHAIVNVSATYGSNYPASGYSAGAAFWMELILTTGLVSVILGTASGAQNVGIIGAFGVGGYTALAGLWGSPISGAPINPARTFGPDLASTTFTSYWVYIAGPLAGAVIAVVIAFVLRGPGGGKAGAGAAQGELFTETYESGKS